MHTRNELDEFEIHFEQLPLFELTIKSLEMGFLTKAHRTNREYTSGYLSGLENLSDLKKLVFFDPQTSGGLLISVSSEVSDQFLKKLSSRFSKASKIGKVTKPQPIGIKIIS